MTFKTQIRKLSFWISFVSLVISGAALWHTWSQDRLNSNLSEAIVHVTSAKLIEPITDASFIKVCLTLQNMGRSTAADVFTEMDYETGSPAPSGSGGNSVTRIEVGDLAPGEVKTVTLQSNRINRRDWPIPDRRSPSVYFYGSVWFKDAISSKTHKRDWCFVRPLKTQRDLKILDLVHPGVLTYKSE